MAIPKIEIKTEQIEDQNLEQGNQLLKAEIHISSGEDALLGTAFHLEYDPEALAYIKHESGDFFEQSAKPIYLVRQKDNKIYFGETLKKDDQLAKGEGKIVTFYFQTLKNTPAELKFSNTTLAGYTESRIDIQADWQNLTLQNNIFQAAKSYNIAFILLSIAIIATLIFFWMKKRRDRII